METSARIPVLAPLGVVAGDAMDEGDVHAGNAGTADLATHRLTSPEQLETLAYSFAKPECATEKPAAWRRHSIEDRALC
jgi:hypothetical protein